MITLKADQLSEQHLAEIALAIRNRWNVPTFVKMHEVIILDDDDGDGERESGSRLIEQPIDAKDVERGMNVILRNLELDRAFSLERRGKDKFRLKLVDPSMMPKWVEKASQDLRIPPEGVYECPHCGKRFPSDFELSLHTKLHYIL